ncbi:serine/threonine protein kinase [Histoplasma capsulatum var. duboisii H88]|uniref:Serine/threonine protein kinase n=1 Tax=Ajellomyces capsulatus (strain H88) TaxID=544711 RepID=F0UII1_AJEC8|nr:serine/threonine protein kinase [Histoplasma capsulatum var. duboisii H88]
MGAPAWRTNETSSNVFRVGLRTCGHCSIKELKHVSRCVLEALATLHDDGYVRTDVKLENIFVNYKEGDVRFSEVQLGDLDEMIMETPWNIAADIWSFGAVPINLFTAATLTSSVLVLYDHEEYGLEVLKQQFRYFGPSPVKCVEIASPETITAILYLMHDVPQSKTTPFHWTTERSPRRIRCSLEKS